MGANWRHWQSSDLVPGPFREVDINWVKHVFYGGSVRENGRDLVLSDIERVAKSFPEVEGMVVIDSEDENDREIWSIKDGKLLNSTDVRKSS